MAEQFFDTSTSQVATDRPQPERFGARTRIRAWALATRLRLDALSAFVLVGATSLVGIDIFGALVWFWPLCPTAVPCIVIGLALIYGCWRLILWLGQRGRR